MNKNIKTTEGDVNNSDIRELWQSENLSEKVKNKLLEDSKYFLKQALSTPCLNTAKAVEGVYIIDGDDRKIIDFHGNSAHQLGYNHPKLIEALQNQLGNLSFSPRRYANNFSTACAKKLVELMPSDDFKVLFTTSGAVSNETALKIVRYATGKTKTLAAEDSFHGATLHTIAVGGTEHFRKGLGEISKDCIHYPNFTSDIDENRKIIDFIEKTCKEQEIGALLAEPVRCTDVRIPTDEYWKEIRRICDENGVVLIFDEIPTGFGRTGKMFAFENFGVVPDMLTLGKGMGGSLLPFSAVIVNKKFDVCEHTSMGHFTHEKNPMGSAVTLALIREIEENDLLTRSNEIGIYIKKRLLEIKSRIDIKVRAIGALVGAELYIDGQKAENEAEIILYECLKNGLSFKVSGGNVLTLCPPLVISDEELKTAMDIIENAVCSLK